HKGSGTNPYQSLENLRGDWKELRTINIEWKAPGGIYWLCGKKAYSELPCRWKGSCTLGMMQPSFFTLPRSESSLSGAPL
ncbi:ENR1 protein, partial [Cisticola juncidis]|nr:ENR1 protein [Cisticola juncidis]